MKNRKHEATIMSSNDARIAVLETTIININSTLLDIKQDMKNGFDALDRKFEGKFDALDRKIDAVELKLENKIDAIDKKFDAKFDAIQNRLWSNFLWLMGMMIGLAGLIAHTQHWV